MQGAEPTPSAAMPHPSCPSGRHSRARRCWLLSTRLSVAVVSAAIAGVTGAGAQPTSTATYTTSSTPALRINEVLAANTLVANGSSFPDIIELHNAGGSPVDLSGMSLSDDPLLPRKYVFPAGTTLAAGGYLLVYADTNNAEPGLHTGFSLDAEGDQVRLYATTTAGGGLIDAIQFGFQIPNHSVSRTGPAANVWALTAPTPGAINVSPTVLAGPGGLKLNEWAGKIAFRLDHDLIELFNTAAQPVPITGVRLTDDPARPTRFVFPALSYIAANGFLPLFGADFGFGLDGDIDPIYLSGENGITIDQVALSSQVTDTSSGRTPDGSAAISAFTVPTPGISNQTPLPAGYNALLSQLRITELMYQPAAPSNAGDYEYIELQNIGATPLDLSGVRFTNGLDYTFRPGTTLAGGAYIVVARDRSSFLSRYPGAASVLAAGSFSGALDNTGETLALTLPSPWYVHILRFRFEPAWFASASGGGYALVVADPMTTAPIDWREPATWRASSALNGSPGAAEPSSPIAAGQSRIINLSILTPLSSPNDSFRMGFVVGGSNTSGSKPLVIRAAGPSLSAFLSSGMLNDSKLEVYTGPTKSSENDNWGGSPVLAASMAAVGAFPYASAASLDAALSMTTAPGDHSVLVSAGGESSGLVLAEVYDASPQATVSATTPRLINVSVLKEFAGGFTAGFVIAGTGSKAVLIRAVGPGLAAVGVTGFVADPQLVLLNASQQAIGDNNNWGGSTGLAETFRQLGAFTLPADSKDAALLVTLQPGNYTVQVSGVAGATGLGLLEVYEVP